MVEISNQYQEMFKMCVQCYIETAKKWGEKILARSDVDTRTREFVEKTMSLLKDLENEKISWDTYLSITSNINEEYKDLRR